MRICVDENIPSVTVQELRAGGYDILDLRGTPEEGTSGADLWKRAQSEQRLLVTTDKGFATRREEPHFGILIIRLRQPNRQKIHERIMQAIRRYPPQGWHGLLVVMRDSVQSVWPPR
ncbi:hypothetical protein BH24GEM3_BH24GEM3_10340 [soil metagenome]